MATRRPAVAGYFYPGDSARLRQELVRHVVPATARQDAIAVVAPHAGYMYSGPVAGAVYGAVQVPAVAVVLGPNHSGLGPPVSFYREGAWETPLGLVRVDDRLANAIERGTKKLFVEEVEAHRMEHSIEVQLPFLQHLRPDLRFVPICLGTADPSELRAVGEAVGRAVARSEEGVLIVASSDFTHYEPQEAARRNDAVAIADVERLDEDAMLEHVETVPVTMCGYAAVYAAIVAARVRGAKAGRLVRYQTSGDVSGDLACVVGYAGMVLA